MSNILVTGSSLGLGRLMVDELEKSHTVFGYDIREGKDVCTPDLSGIERLDVLVNNASVNAVHWLEDYPEADWDRLMDTNVKGIFKMTQAALPLLRESRGTVLNIVSNAARVPMRCSAAYNASKGAAAMLTKQLARELSPDITVFSVSPNKLEGTSMSRYIESRVPETRGWTPEQAHDYQLGSLLPGAETPPRQVAEFIAYLLKDKEHHRYLAGCDIQYGA